MRTLKRQRPLRQRPAVEFLESRELLSSDFLWSGYAGNAQHTALSTVASQPLEEIRWQTPVDLQPQYDGNDLLIHYGEPMITAANTVIVPVKTGATDGFRLEGHSGADGTLKWIQNTDYLLPSSSWTSSFDAVLTPTNRLYFAGAGGTVYFMDNPDQNFAPLTGQVAFYGINNYINNPDGFNSTVFIDTPMTSDSQGNVYFGFRVQGTAPSAGGVQIKSGIARIGADGSTRWVAASTVSGDSNIGMVPHNAAPALSRDESILYVPVRSASTSAYAYLLGLDPATLTLKQGTSGPMKAFLKDPRNGGANNASIPDISTASPMVGPDGDVYYGVFGNPYNGSRGWLLHFNRDLSVLKIPGAFGWDDTASIVPSSMVSSYRGTSSYLIMTKYNNYAGGCCDFADGVNKIAILDPFATQVDTHASSGGLLVMKEILTIAGLTPDQGFRDVGFPNAVREWCINTAAVDPATNSVLANSEDGKLYRWDLTTNTYTQVVTLTSGIGEAYTPTLIGADGTVYAINNATLFAVGRFPTASVSNATVVQSTTTTTTATFTVTIANPTNQTVTVPYLTTDGTAQAGQDYLFTSGVLTFTPDTLTQTVNVPVLANPANHEPRTFTLNLGTPTNARVLVGQGLGTINSGITLPVLSINNTTVTQSTTDVINATFTVTLAGPTQETVTVSFNTVNGTAIAGRDYTAASGMLTFTPGNTSQVITVPVSASASDTGTLTFQVLLDSATNANLGQAQGQGTIMSPLSVVAISDASASEGDAGSRALNFTISLSRPSLRTITVNYATADGSAHAGLDYTAVGPTTLTFMPGDPGKVLTVLISGNSVSEPDKTFFVNLSGAVNAAIGTGQGTGTILNDDGALAISDVTAVNSNVGTTQFIFTVRVVNPSTRPISVDVATADGTAHASAHDYVPLPPVTLNFAPRQPFTTVTIFVNGNSQMGPDLTFFVNLSNPVNAVLARAQAVGTIVNSNHFGSLAFSAANYSVAEAGRFATITVNRSNGSFGGVGVGYITNGGTATANVDYTPVAGFLTFGPGETSQSFNIPIIDDNLASASRTINVVLTTPAGGAALGTPSQATVTIIENDGIPNQRFVLQIYRDLLGREADDAGFNQWSAFLGQGASRTQVVSFFENSIEYRARVTNNLYQQYLGRPADLAGLNMGLAILGNPAAFGSGSGISQLRAILLGSTEYALLHGGTDSGFIQGVYHDVLNRTPDPAGAVALGQFLLNGGTHTAAARLYLGTPEADSVLVSNLFSNYLHRQPGSGELSGYANALLGGLITELDAIAILVGSGEYLSHL